jgi:hypothetical protein
MIAPYYARLACLGFASFFLLHLMLAWAARGLLPAVLRAAEKMRPAAAANLLVLLGLAPAGLSALAVLGTVVPAYLWLEPGVERETVGPACMVAAVLGFALLAESGVRAARACRATARRLGELRQAGHEMVVGQERAWVVDCHQPLFGVIGIRAPRLVVSRAVLEALPADQFDLAVRHETAHRLAGDNLKRLLLLAAPGCLPLTGAWRGWLRHWCFFAERAADARAVEGLPERSVALAEGLVRLARLGSAPAADAALYTPLIQDPSQLASRVEYLLRPPGAEPAVPGWWPAAGASLGALGLVLATRFPHMLRAVHELLEELLALNFFYDLW